MAWIKENNRLQSGLQLFWWDNNLFICYPLNKCFHFFLENYYCHLPFDESTDLVVKGYGVYGKLKQGAHLYPNGLIDHSLYVTDSYLILGSNDIWNCVQLLQNPIGGITLSFWMKILPSTANKWHYFSSGTFFIDHFYDHIRITYGYGRVLYGPVKLEISVSEWVHVVLTGNWNGLFVFSNGTRKAAAQEYTLSPLRTVTNVSIGCYPPYNEENVCGRAYIDDMMVWGGVKSDKFIRDHFMQYLKLCKFFNRNVSFWLMYHSSFWEIYHICTLVLFREIVPFKSNPNTVKYSNFNHIIRKVMKYK